MKAISRNLVRLTVLIILTGMVIAYVIWYKQWIAIQPRIRKPACANGLKQIGLAFRIWADAHNGQYPFNVSTNNGGTLELSVAHEGYAINPEIVFRAMDQELSTPNLLVCPSDHSKQPADKFAHLNADNITYRLHVGTNVSASNPNEVLIVCPIDGNILHCDGTVIGKNVPPDDPNAMKVK